MEQMRDWMSGRNTEITKEKNPQAVNTPYKSAEAEKVKTI